MQPSGPAASTPDATQSLFVRHGLRCTQQRRALYEALAARPCHPTADHLFQELCERGHHISLATVYNTLEAFCRAGIAQKLTGNGASARYDACVHNHLHVIDQKSGAVADVPDCLGEELLRHLPKEVLADLEARLGFKIEQVQIELLGRFVE